MCSVLGFAIFTLLFCITSSDTTPTPDSAHKRYEYLFSFKGPLLVQKDGLIPFWEHGGHAIPSEDKVRLAPSMRNKQGYMWSKKRTNFDGFEIDFSFRITGRGKVGADGMALWFVEEKTKAGPVYGLGDKWKGLGLFFDTYDNDGQLNNPIVLAMVNDGTKSFDHDVDGEGQALGNCIRDFRNRPFPVLVRVRYFKEELTVLVNNGNTDSKTDLMTCFSKAGVQLPKQGYFGVSAATGELADDHDVMTFEVHSLTAKDDPSAKTVPQTERDKYEKEFTEHMEKMKKAQDEYEKEHKNDKKKYKDQGEEAEEVRRLRQIWEEQTAIHALVNGVSAKVDIVINRLDKFSPGGGTSAGAVSGDVPHDVVRKTDLTQARDQMTSAISDMRSAMERMRGTEPHADGGGGASSFYELRQLSHDLRDSLESVKENLRRIDAKVATTPPSQGGTSSCPVCLTTPVFITVTVLNALAIIGAVFFKLNQESSAKKFY